jgi:hypothetical protein
VKREEKKVHSRQLAVGSWQLAKNKIKRRKNNVLVISVLKKIFGPLIQNLFYFID